MSRLDKPVGGGAFGRKRSIDLRQEVRLPLQLKIALVYHQHADAATRPSYHGRTNDISLNGLSMVVDQNIFNEGEVTILLAIPPNHVGGPQKIIEATAKMAYTVFSSEHDSFRIGLNFRQFKRNGKELLKALLESRRIDGGYL